MNARFTLAALVIATVWTTPATAQQQQAAFPGYQDAYAELAQYSFTNRTRAPVPRMILTGAMADADRSNLKQDLQILDHLLSRAVGGSATNSLPGATRSVLGLTVTNQSEDRIQFIQGTGAIFTYSLNAVLWTPNADKEKTEPAKSQNSEWDTARKALFDPTYRMPMQYKPAMAGPRLNPALVQALERRVIKSLSNVSKLRNFRTKDGKPASVTVVLRSRHDGSTITFTTDADRYQGEESKRVNVYRYSDARPGSMGYHRTEFLFDEPAAKNPENGAGR